MKMEGIFNEKTNKIGFGLLAFLLRIFVSMFIRDIGLKFSFFVISLSGFVIRVILASQTEFWNVCPSANVWNSLSRIGVISSLNV